MPARDALTPWRGTALESAPTLMSNLGKVVGRKMDSLAEPALKAALGAREAREWPQAPG